MNQLEIYRIYFVNLFVADAIVFCIAVLLYLLLCCCIALLFLLLGSMTSLAFIKIQSSQDALGSLSAQNLLKFINLPKVTYVITPTISKSKDLAYHNLSMEALI